MDDNKTQVKVLADTIEYNGDKFFKNDTVMMFDAEVQDYLKDGRVALVDSPKENPDMSQPVTASATTSAPSNSATDSAPSTPKEDQSKPAESTSVPKENTSAASATKPTDNFMGKHVVGGNEGPNVDKPLRKSAL